MSVASFNRTLDQELAAIARGASYECLVCGEFLLRRPVAHACLECGTLLCDGLADPGIRARIRLAGRVTASPSSEGAEESPDTAGQGAGEIPGGESRRKVEQKGNRRRGVLRRSRR